MNMNQPLTARSSLVVAGSLLGVAAVLSWLSPEHLSKELAIRLYGGLMGAVLMMYANTVPKALSPLTSARCSPATEQSIRRFTGWSMVLGGGAYSLTWVIAPFNIAEWLSTALLGTTVLLVVIRIAWAKTRSRMKQNIS